MRTKSMRSGTNRHGNNRKIGKPAIVGVLATALAALGTVAAVSAPAATASARGHAQPGLSISKQYFGSTVEPYTGKETPTYRYTLTNAKGMTLYSFAPDSATKSVCYGSCAAYWPPVAGNASAGPGVTGQLGTIKRTNGATQATYDGHPLYTYIGDSSPGQDNGNKINLNGGLWLDVPVTAAG